MCRLDERASTIRGKLSCLALSLRVPLRWVTKGRWGSTLEETSWLSEKSMTVYYLGSGDVDCTSSELLTFMETKISQSVCEQWKKTTLAI